MYSKVIILTFVMLPVLEGGSSDQQLTVRVYNHSSVDARTFSRARSVAERLIRRSGVTLQWTDCDAPTPDEQPTCSAAPDADDVALRIIDGSRIAQPFGGETLGSTLTGRYITVYAKGVIRTSEVAGVSVATVLGLTMAHELGHVLIGNIHSAHGVMAARWTNAELQAAEYGKLMFSGFERQRIRENTGTRGFSAVARGVITH